MLDLSNSPLIAAYRAQTPGSAALAKHAIEALPAGVNHESRVLDPYPLYIDHAQGPWKWDVDGNAYVDYFGGHGALLLGHRHPKVTEAVHAQLDRGTHFGACHEQEVRWAELVKQLIPSAELVRFTSSGSEATLLAVRLARAFMRKPKLIRFVEHYHGWSDIMVSRDGAGMPGVLGGVGETVLLAQDNDIESVTRLLEAHKDVAAVIVEPTGANSGMIPLKPEFLRSLREVTTRQGVLLIFDEVVTAFRVAPGGAQTLFDIRPDLTTLAKILAGGLPGGAVAGRKDIMGLLDPAASGASGREKVAHSGTFNANPVAAAAGVATLEIVASTDACAKANQYGETIRQRLNEMLEEERVPWAAYGTFSKFQIFLNARGIAITPTRFDPYLYPPEVLKTNRSSSLFHKLRLGMLLQGVDLTGGGSGSFASATHGEEEMTATVEGLRKTIHLLRQEGEL
jgi:glutamate-1-semialdehyde 2,1-aminomutase